MVSHWITIISVVCIVGLISISIYNCCKESYQSNYKGYLNTLPVYSSKDGTKIFLINLKCYYSSFEHLASQNKVLKMKREQLNSLKGNPTFYMIVKNPYKRLLSFYKDKFIRNVHQFNSNTICNDLTKCIQICQKNMLNYASKDKIKNKQFSENDFINALKKGYDDSHLTPQSIVYKDTQQYTKNIHLIYIDDPEQRKFLEQLIGYTFPHLNKINGSNNYTITPKVIEYVNKKYDEDFNHLHFRKLSE